MDRFSKLTVFSLPVIMLALSALLLRELRLVRGQLDRQDARIAALTTGGGMPAAPTVIDMKVGAGWKAIGRADAPVTVVEFTDYECPFCKQFHSGAFEELKRNYIDRGTVRWVSRDLPLDMHPYAARGAEAARCADDQGKFWEMRDALLASALELRNEVIVRAAKNIALDLRSFSRCMDTRKYRVAVEMDVADAVSFQIVHTPAFVVARTAPETLHGVVILGALPYGAFEFAIDSVLKN